MFGLSAIATVLIGVSVFAQYMIKKRLKSGGGLKATLQWIAWGCGLLGGTAAGTFFANLFGLGKAGTWVAALVVICGGILLAVDIKDKRPDWPATICAIVLPSFMLTCVGGIGNFFTQLMHPLISVNVQLASLIGL